MSGRVPEPPSLLVRIDEVAPVVRGVDVVTYPGIGRWNSAAAGVTTGVTELGPGTRIPLHTHNVAECVLVLEGEAVATIGDETFEVSSGTNTWVPAGVPHCFANRGTCPLRIFWVYEGRHVTRTICATGETVEHLSDRDRGATRD